MREIRTSGLMSGEGKRSDANAVQTTAPFLDSTEAILYRWICDLLARTSHEAFLRRCI